MIKFLSTCDKIRKAVYFISNKIKYVKFKKLSPIMKVYLPYYIEVI